MAWLLCLMLLAFLLCSIGLAHAEPDSTSSTIGGSTEDDVPSEALDEDEDLARGPDEPSATDREGLATDTADARADDEGIATEPLDDASIEDPAPASTSAQLTPTWAHDSDAREALLRKHTPWFGRIDVSITWRRALNESTRIQRDEVWLVGTWRL